MFYTVDNFMQSKTTDCNKCQHFSVCKYTSDRTRLESEMAKIEKTPLSPLRLYIYCRDYKELPKKPINFEYR